MKSFTDAAGEVWDVEITIGSLQLVRSRMDLCLVPLELEDAKSNRVAADFDRLGKDHALFLEMVYTLVEAQAQSRRIDRLEFGRRFDLGAFLDARDAVDEEVTLFTQSRTNKGRVRAAMRSHKATGHAALTAALDETARQIETGEIWKDKETAEKETASPAPAPAPPPPPASSPPLRNGPESSASIPPG